MILILLSRVALEVQSKQRNSTLRISTHPRWTTPAGVFFNNWYNPPIRPLLILLVLNLMMMLDSARAEILKCKGADGVAYYTNTGQCPEGPDETGKESEYPIDLSLRDIELMMDNWEAEADRLHERWDYILAEAKGKCSHLKSKKRLERCMESYHIEAGHIELRLEAIDQERDVLIEEIRRRRQALIPQRHQ